MRRDRAGARGCPGCRPQGACTSSSDVPRHRDRGCCNSRRLPPAQRILRSGRVTPTVRRHHRHHAGVISYASDVDGIADTATADHQTERPAHAEGRLFPTFGLGIVIASQRTHSPVDKTVDKRCSQSREHWRRRGSNEVPPKKAIRTAARGALLRCH
jgi:hypothetical protein